MKLGPHVIQTTAAALAWAARAPTVKQLDGTAALRLALSGAMTIYRRYWPDDVQNRRIAAGAVDETVQDILEGLEGFRPSYVELFNEVAQLLGAGLEEHADFVTGAADRLHRQGLKVLAFSFSTGNPGPGEWQYLRSRGFCGADAVGLHEYWGAAGLTPWHGLRHRLAHQWTAGQHPPFVVTECGRDAVDGGGGGWLSSNLEASQYLAELAAYDAAVSQDPYVLGASVFTAGPTPDWSAYSTDRLDLSALEFLQPAAKLGDDAVTEPSPPDARINQLSQQFAFTAEALFHVTRILRAMPGRLVNPDELQAVMDNVAALNEPRFAGNF